MSRQVQNPFIKASAKKKHLKIAVYGPPGVGKTYFGLGFPSPAVIDLEGGTDFYADRFQFSVFDTKSFSEVLNAVEFLETGHHDFKTIVIDPITVIWSALQDGRLEFKTKNIDKAISGEEKAFFSYQDWGQIKRFYSMLMTKLVNLPMHVVMVGRQKDEYEIKGSEMSKIGVKMESEKSTPYLPDICFRLEVGKNGSGKRVAVFEKDRSGYFPIGSRVEGISYESFRPLIDQISKGTQQAVHQKEEEAERKDAEFFHRQENAQPDPGATGKPFTAPPKPEEPAPAKQPAPAQPKQSDPAAQPKQPDPAPPKSNGNGSESGPRNGHPQQHNGNGHNSQANVHTPSQNGHASPASPVGNGKEAGLRRRITAKLETIFGKSEKVTNEWLNQNLGITRLEVLGSLHADILEKVLEKVEEKFNDWKKSKNN